MGSSLDSDGDSHAPSSPTSEAASASSAATAQACPKPNSSLREWAVWVLSGCPPNGDGPASPGGVQQQKASIISEAILRRALSQEGTLSNVTAYPSEDHGGAVVDHVWGPLASLNVTWVGNISALSETLLKKSTAKRGVGAQDAPSEGPSLWFEVCEAVEVI